MLLHTSHALARRESGHAQRVQPSTASDPLTRLGDAIASTWRWSVGAAIVGLAPGWTLWALLHADLDALAANEFTADARSTALRWALASLLTSLGLYVALWRRRGPFGEHAALWNRRLLLLAGTPLLALLAAPDLGTRLGFVALAACATLAVLAGLTASAWPTTTPRPRLLATLVGVLTLATAAALCHLGVVRHHALVSNIYDLGIFENILWHSVHGDLFGTTIFPGGNFSSEHFAPLLLLLAPLYAIFPAAETLICFQTIWLCSAVIPLWLWTTRRHGSPTLAAALCIAWLLSPFVHSNALWDFHDLTLGVPLVLWSLWALDSRRRAVFWCCLAALLMVREEMALVALLLGLFAVLEGERRRGAAVMLISLAWFLLVARLLAPSAGLNAYPESLHGGLSESSSYADLSSVIVTDPVFLALELFRAGKFGLLLMLFVPLALLPALGGRVLLLMAPGAVILALSANKAVASPAFHYTSFFLPVVFAAVAPGVLRLERWLARPAAREASAAIVVAALAFNWSFGVFGPSQTFRAGFSTVTWSLTPAEQQRHAFMTRLAAELPPDACVAATGKPGAHLAGRRCLIRFGDRDDVDYFVVLLSELNTRSTPQLRNIRESGLFREQQEAHGILVLERIH